MQNFINTFLFVCFLLIFFNFPSTFASNVFLLATGRINRRTTHLFANSNYLFEPLTKLMFQCSIGASRQRKTVVRIAGRRKQKVEGQGPRERIVAQVFEVRKCQFYLLGSELGVG